MRVLVLVLASDTEPVYREHQRLWRTYMQSNPSVDCYFYKGNPALESEAELRGDTLFLRIEDTLDTVYEKTLRAFAFFRPRLSEYAYVFRTNLSSVVIFDRYLEYCKTLPRTQFCSARVGDESTCLFPSGSGFTLTPDLVCRLVDEQPPLHIQDDVSIGRALKDWGIPITPAPRVDLFTPDCVDVLNGRIPSFVFHFRVRQVRGETLPELDVMQSLISYYYGNRRPLRDSRREVWRVRIQ